ncbi:hypothetical protein HBI56_180630 [Parastagonospora nodorum]|nr:hypothetical protein HBH53_214080 [Parastagonospora nodorum]KAH3958238.1 hypothetical protein HBH51_212320 [Parastagonospora nodorum]KAH3992055.1 hypothetical protein HBI10_222250 [Parastagonospora nodorum]KAH4009629.1 hypothetical protein HBI13_217210 [Parastagonospora nodorum]KAH4043512.1 hypothetical protein HBH49_231300 [Parastagonospora nodorum]
MAVLPLPRHLQSFVDKLRSRLASDGLLEVLDSFPPPSSFEFQDATIRGQKAVRLRLGTREQDDATRATSWAYVMHANPLQKWKGEHEPPILIRDEIRGSDDTPRLLKRAATSLLRKSGELLPPFCFLQFDSQDKVTHVRDTLCALVLYYSLANGLTDTATKWSKFEDSLVLALEYIDDSANYQRWQDVKNTDAETFPIRRITRRVRPQRVSHHAEDEADTEDEIDTRTSDTYCKGGVVRSLGSSIPLKPGSNMAKIIAALGDRASLLDAIPSTAVTFSGQNLISEYDPIVLEFGAFGESTVNVYLTQGVKGDTRILAQDSDGELLHWKFGDLTGIDLVEPFDSIMRLDQELPSRGNKIRYLVLYYFMLAEHAGLIGKPSAPWKHESMVPALRAACNHLRNTSTGDTTDEDIRSNKNHPASELQKEAYRSLIVKLRVHPDVLIAKTKAAPAIESEEAADNDQYSEKIAKATTASDHSSSRPNSSAEGQNQPTEGMPPVDLVRSYLHTEQEVPLSCGDTAQEMTGYEEISLESGNETYVSAMSIANSRDSFSASSPAPPILPSTASPNALPSDAVALSDAEMSPEERQQPETATHERATPETANTTDRLADKEEGDSLQAEEIESGVAEPNLDQRFILLRGVSVVSISSDEDEATHPEEKFKEETSTAQRGNPASFGRSEAIYLGSDEETVLPEPINQVVERTPEIGAAPHPPQPTAVDSDSNELRWPGDTKKRKRSLAPVISNDDDDDDDDLLEADGNAWKKASLGRSGGKGTSNE